MAQPDSLKPYRDKRSPDRTPEPAGRLMPVPGSRIFVVQKHDATNLHWDFRLELDGVLKSWAVPKGPSMDPADKRFAAYVEDHPLEYAYFEGVIPKGNYGAGPVIVWDRGTYVPLEDMAAGLEKGKLLFELRGHKLLGRWTLVRMKTEKDWLLIKERDAQVRTPGNEFDERSVHSGLLVQELGEGIDAGAPVRALLEELGAPCRRVKAETVKVMLATRREEPFTRDGWLFELKYDGYRILAAKEAGEPRIISRNGNDLTGTFPELATILRALPYEHVVLDGEVVVNDERGLPSFQRLQKRGRLSNPREIRRLAFQLPATFYAFDLLAFEDYDLRPLPLAGRKRVLQGVLPAPGPFRYSDHIETQGVELYHQVERMGLEGVVGKKADARYRGGRSTDWIKVRADRADDFVVVGFTAPKGSRAGFGALDVAAHHEGELRFIGSVGTGFTQAQLRDTGKKLREIVADAPACTAAPTGDEHTWVRPTLVVEVRYLEVTEDGLLRQPAFLRFRDDKDPEECTWPVEDGADEKLADGETRPRAGGTATGSADAGAGSRAGDPAHARPTSTSMSISTSAVDRTVHFTNRSKMFWPDEGYTKGDLIDYYEKVADWILPYLRDRPLVQTRYPDGIHGMSFFQKDAPEWAPGWLRTETIYSEGSERDLDYFICDDTASLLYVANAASIPLHVWSSRIDTLERPDWSILDLDPKDAPFTDVVTVANALHAICDDIDLPCFVKTSGSSGLHVLVPTAGRLTHEQSRQLAELLARVVVKELPEIATVARAISKRKGRVYLDYLQNGWGKLLVAPFSVRPVPGARVSAPLRWKDVTPRLDIARYTIASMPRRMAQLKEDPFRGVLDQRPDLMAALEKLLQRV